MGRQSSPDYLWEGMGGDCVGGLLEKSRDREEPLFRLREGVGLWLLYVCELCFDVLCSVLNRLSRVQ